MLGVADVGTLGGDHISKPSSASHLNLEGDFDRSAFAPITSSGASSESSAHPPDDRVLAVQALLRGKPLEPYAAAMVASADHHGIDWRLLPVISILESEAGLTACSGNAWGFAKCQVHFASFEEGIPIVASTLSSYGAYSSATLLCIWVSGDGCHTRHAIEYTHRAAYLYSQLGASLAVAALPPDVSEGPLPPLQPEPIAAAAPAGPAATPTPTPAAPTPASSPAPEDPGPTPAPDATSPAEPGDGAGG
ncbi:MAG: hypothetical protein WD557_13270 [Dehalococcoidia bacterium]